RSTPKRAGTCSFFMVAPSSPGPAARCQPRSERGPEAEVRPASAFFAEGIIDAQDAQGRVQADTHAVAGLQVAEADRLAGVERVAKVREDDALHGFHDGEAELRVEHQHPVAGQLAVVVAPYRVGAANEELLPQRQVLADHLSIHAAQREGLALPAADFDVRAVLGLQLGEFGRAAQKAPGPLHRQQAAEAFRGPEEMIGGVRADAQRHAAGAAFRGRAAYRLIPLFQLVADEAPRELAQRPAHRQVAARLMALHGDAVRSLLDGPLLRPVIQVEPKRRGGAQEVRLVEAQLIHAAGLAELPAQVGLLAVAQEIVVRHFNVADEAGLGAVAGAEGGHAGLALLDANAHAQRVRIVQLVELGVHRLEVPQQVEPLQRAAHLRPVQDVTDLERDLPGDDVLFRLLVALDDDFAHPGRLDLHRHGARLFIQADESRPHVYV